MLPKPNDLVEDLGHHARVRDRGEQQPEHLRFTGARPDPLGVVLTLAGLLALALFRGGGPGR